MTVQLPATPALMTVDEFCKWHSKITPRDVRMCLKGTHPSLPPLDGKKKRYGDNEPYLITAEAAAEWRALLPDA